MKLAVTDANIFIDLFHIDLVQEFFQLEIELYTSLEVVDELDDDQQALLRSSKKLTILEVGEVNFLEELGNSLSSGLSIADTSVFHHARELNSGILTGDNLLRKISEKLGFEVHGIIWLMDEIVKSSLVMNNQAVEKLEELMEYNKRLPTKDCEKMIRKWSKI